MFARGSGQTVAGGFAVKMASFGSDAVGVLAVCRARWSLHLRRETEMEEMGPSIMAVGGSLPPPDCREMFIVISRSSLSPLANLCVTTRFCFCPGASGRGCFPSSLPLGLSPASSNTTPGPQLFPSSSSLRVCCSSPSLHRRTPSSRAFRPSYSLSHPLSIAFFEFSCLWYSWAAL